MAFTSTERREQRRRGPKDKAALMREMRNRDRHIPYKAPTPEADRRRRRLEKDPAKWLSYYCPDRFPLPFGKVHREIITACIRAMTAGTSITVAAPRGFGKTAILWGMSLYGVLTGLCRFPVVIGWKASAGAELLDQWLQALSGNERLAEDYPCQCGPFQDSTASNRLKGILRSIEPEEKAGCDVRKGRGMVLLPDVDEGKEPDCQLKEPRKMPQVGLAGASMNGSIKGLNIGLLSGESLRPDIVLMDDPQDEQTADSATLVKKVIKKIDYGIRSLSGPRRRLTVMAAVTCVNIGDVSDHLLTRPGTEAIKTGQLVTWPDGWHEKNSASKKQWDEWNAVRLRGLENLDGGKAARAYYRKHKDELTAGMSVSWKERYHVGDGLRASDPDALFAAMWDYYDLGEFAFMAERQNAPLKEGITVYTLNEQIIKSRAQERKPGVVPEWAQTVIAATDINPSYALTTVVAAFGAGQVGAVTWYGLHTRPPLPVPKDATEIERRRIIYEALSNHGRELASLPCRPAHWFIDGGGSPEGCVIQFGYNAPQICGLQASCCFGRGWKTYRATSKATHRVRIGEQLHHVTERRDRQWLIYNADYWREIAQRGWTGEPGAPGSCSLPAGNHADFAAQVCREQLAGKDEVAGRLVWIWNTLPGPHDYGDCMQMLYMGAAVAGIGTGARQPAPQQKRRRPKMEMVRI